MNKEDKQLLVQIHNSQTRQVAFEVMVRKYSRMLFAHLAKYIRSREDIEDVLQTVWIKVWRGLENFRGESLLTTWLYTIATREAYNFHRKSKVIFTELTEHNSLFASEKSDWNMQAKDILERLQHALDTLPQKQKEVFIMRYFEEMSYEEMSVKTGTSQGALKASYHHAVKKIEQFVLSH